MDPSHFHSLLLMDLAREQLHLTPFPFWLLVYSLLLQGEYQQGMRVAALIYKVLKTEPVDKDQERKLEYMRRSATAKPEYILSTLNCGDIVLTSKSRKIHWPLNVVPRQAILTSNETIPLDNNSVFKLGFAWKKKNRQHSQDELVIH